MKAIFWDMDGTLVNSEPLWGIATYEMSEAMGKRLTPEERELTVGGSFHNTYMVCCRIAGVEPSEEDEARRFAFMRDRMVELLSTQLEPFPGVRELLGELKAEGIPMFVTTNTARCIAQGSIDGVGSQYFTDSVCGDEVPHGKPAPDMYLEAARRVGADPAECLVFEDSASGMRAATDAGCRVIGRPEHDGVEVPEGVIRFQDLAGSLSYEGIHAADIHRWFELFDKK